MNIFSSKIFQEKRVVYLSICSLLILGLEFVPITDFELKLAIISLYIITLICILSTFGLRLSSKVDKKIFGIVILFAFFILFSYMPLNARGYNDKTPLIINNNNNNNEDPFSDSIGQTILENAYWIAGIVLTITAIVELYINWKNNKEIEKLKKRIAKLESNQNKDI